MIKILMFNMELLIEKESPPILYVVDAELLARRYISGTDLKHIEHGMRGINELENHHNEEKVIFDMPSKRPFDGRNRRNSGGTRKGI